MTNLFDSLPLLPNSCDPTEFMTWLDAMMTFVQQHMSGSNDDVLKPHLLDILFGGVWITDKNDIVIYANNTIAEKVGVPKDQMTGREIFNGFPINIFQHFIPSYLKAKSEGRPVKFGPIPVHTPAGKNHQVGWFFPRYNDEQFNGMICSLSDANKSINPEILETRWQAICDCSPDCIMLIDPKGVILFTNRPLSGFSENEMLGSSLYAVIPESSRKEVEKCLQQVKRTKTIDRCFSEYPAKDGGIAYFETRIGPVVWEGNILGFIVNSSDITRQKLLEQEINKYESNLQETNITLKVLLKRIENERLLFQENLSTNILCNIEPYMNKLKQTSLDRDQIRTLEVLEKNIKDMASPLIYSAMTMNLRLTPAEMQISNFIRQGYSSKEIAELLNISPATIDKHRKNVRRKLGITNKKQNLRSVLSSISS
jgi:PAS domain S-box-containing protein